MSVNDLDVLENAHQYYIKAVNYSYRASFMPPAFIIFILALFLHKLKYNSNKGSNKQKNSEEELIKEIESENENENENENRK